MFTYTYIGAVDLSQSQLDVAPAMPFLLWNRSVIRIWKSHGRRDSEVAMSTSRGGVANVQTAAPPCQRDVEFVIPYWLWRRNVICTVRYSWRLEREVSRSACMWGITVFQTDRPHCHSDCDVCISAWRTRHSMVIVGSYCRRALAVSMSSCYYGVLTFGFLGRDVTAAAMSSSHLDVNFVMSSSAWGSNVVCISASQCQRACVMLRSRFSRLSGIPTLWCVCHSVCM